MMSLPPPSPSTRIRSRPTSGKARDLLVQSIAGSWQGRGRLCRYPGTIPRRRLRAEAPEPRVAFRTPLHSRATTGVRQADTLVGKLRQRECLPPRMLATPGLGQERQGRGCFVERGLERRERGCERVAKQRPEGGQHVADLAQSCRSSKPVKPRNLHDRRVARQAATTAG